jgi:hypothetical protein
MLDDVSEDEQRAWDRSSEETVRGGKGVSGGRYRIEVDNLSSTRSAEFILEVCTCKPISCGREDR